MKEFLQPISILFKYNIYFHLVQLQAIKYRWSKQFTESSLPSELMVKFITIEKLYDDVTCLIDSGFDNTQNTNHNSGKIFSEIGTFLYVVLLIIIGLFVVIVSCVTEIVSIIYFKYRVHAY